MSHDDAFATFRAERDAERATAVKVTWRKVSPMTGGGWSALGRDGALGFVNPKRPSGYEYGLRDGKDKPVAGVAMTLARAKRVVEQLLVESACKTSLAIREETSSVRAVNNHTHTTWKARTMETKITALTAANISALNEVLPTGVVATTASTATFGTDAEGALRAVTTAMNGLPGTGHPRQSLHAVVRKLKQQAAKEPAALSVTTTTTAAPAARKEATVATTKKNDENTETITAEQFAGAIEGVEAVRAAKAPTARLRANGKTLAYADDRKGGFMMSIAAEAVEAAPKTHKDKLEIKGRRATLRVTTKNAKGAAALVGWLAKQAA